MSLLGVLSIVLFWIALYLLTSYIYDRLDQIIRERRDRKFIKQADRYYRGIY